MKNLEKNMERWDETLIHKARHWAVPFSRFSIFLIYFWFGALKVFSVSPASPLVLTLLDRTMPGVSPESFLVVFGIFEMIIGILFLLRNFERLAIFLLVIHLFTTILPLFILPSIAWEGFLVPTMEGQYIIKNILIVAIGIGLLSHLHVLRHQEHQK